MFQIILIKPNEFNLKDIPYKSSPNSIYKNITRNDFFKIKSNYVDFDKLKEKLLSFIEVIDVDESNFMEKAVQKINLTDKNFGDVRDCYEEPNNIYQIMFKLISQYDNKDKLKNNIFSSFITYERELIYDNVILFKTNLPKENYEMKNCSVAIDDLIHLLMNNIYHTGVFFEGNKIEQVFYNNNFEFVDPLYRFCKRNDIDHILKDEKYGFQNKDILKYNMKIIFDKDSMESINEPMSRIILGPIRGNGVITSPYKDNNSFYDISREEIIEILKISPNFSLTVDESNDKKDQKNRTLVKNKYRILSFRLSK